MTGVVLLSVEAFGDGAVLAAVPGPAQAQALAAAVRAALPDADDVVPGLDTVLVRTAPGGAARAVAVVRAAALAADDRAAPGKQIVVPVAYDGEDLHAVADALSMSPEEVVRRHCSAVYIVAALGFSPGFPYLTGLDPALTVPRLASPRTKVPAGSVGLAAGQTCLYPTAGPGGWRLIGRTSTVLFDPAAAVPALLSPGDTVRFVPVDETRA